MPSFSNSLLHRCKCEWTKTFNNRLGKITWGQLIQSFVNTRLLRCVFRIQLDIYNGTFLQKGSTVDVRLGSKYASVPYKCNHKLSLSSIGIDDSCFAMKFLSVYIPSGVWFSMSTSHRPSMSQIFLIVTLLLRLSDVAFLLPNVNH